MQFLRKFSNRVYASISYRIQELLGQLQSLSSSRNETRQEAYFLPKSYK
jgi:hypothetical protein